jgi:hypothetical protein
MLPGLTGQEQYHEYWPPISGYPKCAFPFMFLDEAHPFLPEVSEDLCAFCKKDVGNPAHNVRSNDAENVPVPSRSD